MRFCSISERTQYPQHTLCTSPPAACLSSHPSVSMTAPASSPPPLSAHRELICRNVRAALCDHSVNTPIILSASASRYHPAVEMTPEGLTVQFSRNGWQLSRQRRREQPASCWLVFIPAAPPPRQQRDAAGAPPAAQPSRRPRCLLPSPPVLWGEMLPLVYATLSVTPTHTLHPLAAAYLSNKWFLHRRLLLCPPPLVLHAHSGRVIDLYLWPWCLSACCR